MKYLFAFLFLFGILHGMEDIDAINQRCYDNRADNWDRFPFPEDIPELVEKNYSKGISKRVLDIGSGTGVLADWLAKQGFQVLCLDPSDEMVRRCRAKGLETVQAKIQDYLTEDKYGMVFAILSFIHLPKGQLETEIAKVSNLMENDGLFFLGLLEGEGERITERAGGFPRFFAYYAKEEILQKLAPYFTCLAYRYHHSKVGYMLFLLKKK